MARKVIRGPIEDEAGNRLGTSGTEIRVYTDEALATPATLYADTTSGSTIVQPLYPNAGGQTVLTVNTLTTDAVITVADVSTFHVGDRLFLYNGTTTTYRTITAINGGAKTITLSQTVGTAYSTTNTQVGGAHMLGNVNVIVADSADTFIQVKDIASGVLMDAVQILTNVPVGAINVQEEGTLVNNRGTLNFIGASTTAVDNPGQSRVDVTTTGLQADGTVSVPSIGFVSDSDTGFYHIGANDFAAVAGGHSVLEYFDNATAVNYFRMQNRATGSGAILEVLGTDASIDLRLQSKGTGGAVVLDGGKTDYGYVQGGTGVWSFVAAGGSASVILDLRAKGTEGINVGSHFTDYMKFLGGTGTSSMYAVGGSAVISINFVPKSTGVLQYNGVQMWPMQTATAALGGDVTMVTANSFYDGPSVSLVAGTWFVEATVSFDGNGQAVGGITAKLWDGTTTVQSSEEKTSDTAGKVSITVHGIVTPGSTTTYKVSATGTSSNFLMKAATTDNGAGNNASRITAIKIG